MELEINRWITDENIKIISIQGNIAPQAGKHTAQGSFSAADVLVIVLYDK
jgi:hypothetical protein